jgi:membrane associated rhomboid family serine protease
VVFFAEVLLTTFVPDTANILLDHTMLRPSDVLHGMIWQLGTYPFIPDAPVNLLSLAFALLSVWFFGSRLEDDRGSRWFKEYCLCATVGGAVVATLLTMALRDRIPGLGPDARTATLWPLIMGIMLAYARFYPDEELRLYFVLRLKAKYLVAIYLLVYLAITLIGGGRFSALVALTNALCGYAFLQLAPRQGLRFAASERWYGVRNAFYRAKRRRAAKKFEVYMRGQGKDVHVNPDDKRDSNDRRWMN